MRSVQMILFAGATLGTRPAFAADALKYGPAPAWVQRQPIPTAKPTEAPVLVLLGDQQTSLEPGKVTSFTEGVLKIQNSQGLAAGNLSLVWQPATDTVTVNKLHIIRGDKVIDVLADGQTFTVLRRETNLDAATLDGTLTATIQPEGLQEGDVIDFATTIERSDPVLKGHVETMFGEWNALPMRTAHASLSWPKDIHLNTKETPNLPPLQRLANNGTNQLSFSIQNVEPLVPPNGAPQRFTIGRLAEASDFAAWSDVADLMIPLFRDASAIANSGSLHDEVEKIRASTTDPTQRAEQALALVQNRIRYVALLMGQGGYVPAPAETTWSRRFGDCKAKTALLMGILRSLGIEAEPVLVQSKLGDIVADRLPMLSLFDHVLVRAHVGGKDYWLDGTRTGDTNLDSIEIPDFGWGLPLVEHAQLIHLIPKPLERPEGETHLEIDASAGIYTQAPTIADQTVRGDNAISLQSSLASASDAQRNEFFRSFWSKMFDFVTFKSGTFTFDKEKREVHLSMTGTAKLDWSGGTFRVPDSTVGFQPDFARQQDPFHDAPFMIAYPSYKKWVIQLHLPHSFLGDRRLGSADVHETLAGFQYDRTATVTGDILTVATSERSVSPEISYKDAKAAESRLTALSNDEVQLPLPQSYRTTAADLEAMKKNQPADASGLVTLGNTLMNSGKYEDAEADFTKALSINSKDAVALADRAIAYVWQRKSDLAAKDINAALAIDPDNAVALRAQALQAEFKHDCDSAVEAYTKSLKTESDNGFAIGHRALCEYVLGREDSALADAELALKSSPDWVALRALRATVFLSEGKTDQSASEAQLLVKQSPDSVYAQLEAGRIYAQAGKTAESLKAFDAALAIKPSAAIYITRARWRPASDKSGRTADLLAALKLEPDNVDAIAEEARQFAMAGDFKRSIELYNRLVNPMALFSEFAAMHATVLYKDGRTAEAEKVLVEQRRKAKTAAQLAKLCSIKAGAGILLDGALKDCDDAVRLDPADEAAMESRGFVLLRLGKFDDAIESYTKAIAKKPTAASYMGRALAYSRKGDKIHSDQDRAKALNLDSDAQMHFAEYDLKLDDVPSAAVAAAGQQAVVAKP